MSATPGTFEHRAEPGFHWIILLFVLGLTATILAVTVKGFHLFSDEREEPFIQGADDTHYFLWLRSWVVDRDIDFANDVRDTPFLEEEAKIVLLNSPRTKTGKIPNKFPVGWAVVSAPAYLVAHSLAPLTSWSADGFSPPYQIAIWLQHMLIAAAGFAMLFDLLKRWFPSRIAATAMLATWLTSPLIYYQTARISMVHNVIYVLAILIFWVSLKIRDELEAPDSRVGRIYWLSGIAGFHAGLLVICRPSAVVYLIVPIAWILEGMFGRKRAYRLWLAMTGLAVVGALIGLLPQLIAWKSLYGDWIYYSYQGEGFNWGNPRFATSLISAHHGLFNWHPALVIGLAALLFATWKGRFHPLWILSLVGIVWLNSAWHMVYFGSAFGGRAYEFLVFFATFGLAYFLGVLAEHPIKRNLLLGLFTLLSIWNIVFMYLFMQGMVSREDPVTWMERLNAVSQWFST